MTRHDVFRTSLHLLAWLLTLALVAMFPLSRVAAQSTTSGDIAGVVTDPSGAAIAGATVTLTSNATGASHTLSTGANGAYRFFLLPPGSYVVSAAATGFSPKKATATVSVGQIQTVNLALRVGAATQTVTVTGEAAPVQITNANVSTNFTAAQIAAVPNGGGDLTAIVQASPGTVMNTQAGYGNFSTFGLGGTSNLFTINGMQDNDPFLSVNNSGATNLMLGQNDVQQVTVTNNGYSGQFGSLAGANVNYVTKSGSNDWHGNANYFWNGRVMNANNFFNNASGTPRPFVNANQWSASVGGPVVKDHTFFFVDTEGLNVVLPTSNLALIPSPQFQTATLANLTATGQSGQVPFYNTMFNLYNGAPGASRAVPVAGGGCGSFTGLSAGVPCALQFESTAGNHTHEWDLAARVDQNMSASDHLFFQFSTDHGLQATFTDPINPGFNIQSNQPQYNGQLNWTHSFGAVAVNQLVASGAWYSAIFGEDPASRSAIFPAQMNITGGLFTTLGGSDGIFPQGRKVTQWGLVDDYSETIGAHTLKLGMNYNLNLVNDFGFGIGTTPTITTSLASLFAGTADIAAQSFPTVLNQPVRIYDLGGYIEDDIRVSPDLHMNFTLRGEHPSNPVCPHNCFSNLIDPFTSLDHNVNVPYNQIIQTGRSQALPSYNSFLWQPRVGLAWTPFGHQSTVVRSGFGVFNDTLPALLAESFATNAPNENSFVVTGPMSPAVPNNVFSQSAANNTAFLNGFNSGGTLASITATTPAFVPPGFFTSNAKLLSPRVLEWNLEVQQALGNASSFSINYVGNRGYHEPIENEGLNAFFPGFVGLPAVATDPRFGVITQVNNDGISNYNGVTVSYSRKLSRSFQMQANYTWSHALDTISNGGFLPFNFTSVNTSVLTPQDPFNLNLYNYGNADYNVPNYFSLNYVWQVPFSNALHWGGDQLWRGWTVSGTLFSRSGLPTTVIDGAAIAALQANNLGPQGTFFGNVIGAGQTTSCDVDKQCLIPTAFSPSTATPTAFGNQVRNGFTGPMFFDTDMSIVKNTQFPGWEKGTLGLGVQFFNLFNHANFDIPVSDLANSSLFGTVTHTVSVPTSILGSFLGGDASPRIIELTAKLTW